MEYLDGEAWPAAAFPNAVALVDGAAAEEDALQSSHFAGGATTCVNRWRQTSIDRQLESGAVGRPLTSALVVIGAVACAVVMYFPLRQLGTTSPRFVAAAATATASALCFSSTAIFLMKKGNIHRWSHVSVALVLIAVDLVVRSTVQSPEMRSTYATGLEGYLVPLVASGLFLRACASGRSIPNGAATAGVLGRISLAAVAILVLVRIWEELNGRVGGSIADSLSPAPSEIANSLTLAVASATVLAASRRFTERRVPAWLLGSLVVWAVMQLPMNWGAATRSAWPASGFAALFASAIALGVFLEMQRLGDSSRASTLTVGARSPAAAPFHERQAEMIKFIAHEMGSPIAAIRTWVAFMSTDRSLMGRHEKIVTGLQREIESVDMLIADLQNVSQMQDDVFEVVLKPTPVRQILSAAAQYAESLPGAHQVISDITATGAVWADPVRIGQVMRNLLNNADKYSRPGSPIILRAEPHRTSIRILVVDHGMGIQDDDCGRIFLKFGRGRAIEEQSLPGMGVGLYVAQSIVRAHHSEIRVFSTPGQGSRFAFELRMVQ